MKRILITGIAGLLGGNLARWIRDNTNDALIGVDDLSCGLRSNIPDGVEWFRARLGRCGYGLDDLVRTWRPDIIYHFAAYAAECLSPFIRCYNYANNLVATAEVVNACLNYGVQRLVFTSSMAVYGRCVPPFDEDYHCHPIDPYGVAKLACEQDIQIAGEQHGLDWVIVRPHNVYGPGQVCTQRFRNVLGIWMDRHMHGLPLRIYGDGQQQRAFSYISDCLRPLYMTGMATSPSREVINLGGTRACSIQQAADTLIEVMGGGELEYCEPRHEVRHAWSTWDKSVRLLHYRDATPLADGLAEMWAWASTREHEAADLPQFEVVDGLPRYWRT